MPLDASLLGKPFGRITATCDARWLMAYSAGIPDARPELFDTTGTLVTHPMFSVAPEWELLTTQRSFPASMTNDEVLRGVHAAHDVMIERHLVPGESIDVTATVVAVAQRRSGAAQTIQFDATASDGTTVWRTLMTTVFIGVALSGDEASVLTDWPVMPTMAASPPAAVAERASLVRGVDAHIYSECARIWNPIHTDVAIARRAGLPLPIFHGTATMARAVSAIADMADARLGSVARVTGEFAAMVDPDTTITIRLLAVVGNHLFFEVLNGDGRPAIRNGTVTLAV